VRKEKPLQQQSDMSALLAATILLWWCTIRQWHVKTNHPDYYFFSLYSETIMSAKL